MTIETEKGLEICDTHTPRIQGQHVIVIQTCTDGFLPAGLSESPLSYNRKVVLLSLLRTNGRLRMASKPVTDPPALKV